MNIWNRGGEPRVGIQMGVWKSLCTFDAEETESRWRRNPRGAPVMDLLRAAHLPCSLTPVTITSGDRAHSQGDHWHVPKRDLLNNLLVLLEAGELRIPRKLAEAGALVRELSAVEMRHRPGGVVRMGADGAGEHDDLVMAVALACWKAKRKENAFVAHRLPGI
jgi:hypothetical protein